MTGDIDNGLAAGDRLRGDATVHNMAIDLHGERAAASRSEPATYRPTLYEEHVWLAQQQAPEAILKHVVAVRLTGNLDIARLAIAITDTVRAFPDLNARYRFSEDGELLKLLPGRQEHCLRIIHTASRVEATETIIGRQREIWESETQPPFECLVMVGPQEPILALVLHRILDQACPAAELLRAMADAYAGRPIALMAKAAPASCRKTLSAPGDVAAMPGWMCRSVMTASLAVADGASGWTLVPLDGAAMRYGGRVNARDIAAPDASEREVFARLAARFARYLSVLCGTRHVDLFLQAASGKAIGDFALSAVRHEFLELSMDGQGTDEQGSCAVLDCMDRPPADPVTRQHPSVTSPTGVVCWMTEPADMLLIDGVSVERLPLPTLEARPDLTLAVGRNVQGMIAVELTTGQRMSPYIGAFLLERFLSWTADPSTALPALVQFRPGDDGGSKPASTGPLHEDAIAALILTEFRDALNVADMDANDDFFDHGGHSLIATRIIGRLLSRHSIEIQFNDLFSYPSAAALARKARLTGASESGSMCGVAGNGMAGAPLSLAQMSLWKAYAAFGFNEIFNLPFALEFLDEVDEAVFARAFADVVERHSGLRSLFRREGEEIRQEVVPISELSRYRWFWSSRDSAGLDRRDEAVHRFDLSKELPFRLRFLIDPATGRQVLSFLFHHIVLDEWSVNQMMDEIAYCYRTRAAGGVPVWSDAPAPFDAFARLQSEAGIDAAHVAFWADALRGAPKPQPILARQKDDEANAAHASENVSAAGGWIEFKLDSATSQGLYALARQNSASLFNVVYAGITDSLRRLGALPELVVGTSASGRSNAAFFDTIGYFTTVVAHRIRFDDAMTVGELVGQVKNTINDSMPYTEIPIDLVEEALGMTPGRDHIFEVFIQIHARNKLNGAFELPRGRSIAFRQVDPERHESMLGLHFEVMEEMIDGDRSIRVLMSYRSENYGPEEVERITATTSAVLSLMSRDGASLARLDALDVVPAAN